MSSICVWCYVICICLVSCHLYLFGVMLSVCVWCYIICMYLVLCHLYLFGVMQSVCVWCLVICMCLVLCHLYVFGAMSSVYVWCYVICICVVLCVVLCQVATEGLRVKIPPGTSQHMARLVKICMNEEAAKRPRFDMIVPILEKMKSTG